MASYVSLHVVVQGSLAVPLDAPLLQSSSAAALRWPSPQLAIVQFALHGALSTRRYRIALALMSAVSAMTMAEPRVYATMAADHALPRSVARYTTRGVPSVAVIV